MEVKKKSYTSLQHDPIEDSRRPTDVFFSYVFMFFLFGWLILNLLVATCMPEVIDIDGFIFLNYVMEHLYNYKLFFISLGSATVCISLAIGYVFLLKTNKAKIFTYFVIFGYGCVVLLTVVWIIVMILRFFNFGSIRHDLNNYKDRIPNLLLSPLSIICKIIILYCLKWVKIKLVIKVINESCRLMMDHVRLLLFSTSVNFLAGLVFVSFLTEINKYLNRYEISGLIIVLINFCGGFFLSSCVYYFGHMVISEYITHRYWNVHRNIPKPSISQSSLRILRYHMGTIVLASTFIFPFVHAILVAFKHKYNIQESSKRSCFVRFVSKVYLVFTIPDFALIQTTMHGYDYYRSSRKTFNMILRNYEEYLVVYDVSGSVLLIPLYEMAFVLSLAAFMFHWPDKIVYDVLIMLPLLLTIYSAIKILFMCLLEDLNENDGSLEKPYFMSYEFQKNLNKSYEQPDA